MAVKAAKLAMRPIVAMALAWLGPVLVVSLICWGTLAPQNPVPRYFGSQDTFEHLLAFGLLGAALTLAAPSRAVSVVVSFCLALAVSVELGQAVLTSHREPSLRDASASILGSVLGIGFGSALRTFALSRAGLRSLLRF